VFDFLKRITAGAPRADSGTIGSESDPMRQMLFASQPLREQVSRMRRGTSPGPMHAIAEAQRLVEQGEKTQAVQVLRGILSSPGLETRTELWVWSGLRELGEKPEGRSAYEVLGAILEIPASGAYDTLAGYVDGSARYLNFSGHAIFWDVREPTVQRLCQALVDATIAVSRGAKLRTSLSLPKRGVQATMLTRSGPYLVAEPSQGVMDAGAALMTELIRRAQEKKAVEQAGTAAASDDV
jgi:hypothetical protein